MSALRPVLDEGSAAVGWPIGCDGVGGRALLITPDTRLNFPLSLAGPVTLSAAVMLLTREWRDSRRTIRASVSVELLDGTRHELWSATLRTMLEGGQADALQVECELPAQTRTLTLAAGLTSPGDGPIRGVVWRGTELREASAASSAEVVPPDEAASELPRISTEGPLISVLTPVHDPPIGMLEQAIESVRAQSYPSWELCLTDDGSTDPAVIATLARHASQDERIKLVRHDRAQGIAAATNAALELASGDYIALLDHDDTLTADALERMAQCIETRPDLDMVYSDEDVTDDAGRRLAVHLKPGWSPDTARTMMYTCHLGVYRRSLALEVGGFRSEFDGTQDYDFILRLMERTDRVAHIPRVLYHWRAHTGSAAGGDQAKPYAYALQPRAIAAHLDRCGVRGRVDFAGTIQGLHRVVYQADPDASVTVIVRLRPEDDPFAATAEISRSLRMQPRQEWRLVVVVSDQGDGPLKAALHAADLDATRITVSELNAHDDPAAALSAAGLGSDSEQILLAEGPFIGLTHDWLGRLMGHAAQSWIGAAGPIVLSPGGRIEQAGIALAHGLPLHLLHGSDGAAATPGVFNVIAVSGVVVTRREIFESLHGLRAEMGGLALVDYCLRAGQRGLYTAVVPDVRLRYVGSDRTCNDLAAIDRLRQAWSRVVPKDPYYNPRYAQDRGDYSPVDTEPTVSRVEPLLPSAEASARRAPRALTR